MSVISNCSYHIYADDVQVYRTCSPNSIPGAVTELNADLDAIYDWTRRNGLVLNTGKSHALAIGSIDQFAVTQVAIGGIVIPYEAKVTSLGLVLNSKLDWRDHISSVSSKVFGGLRSLWPRASVTPRRIRCMLVKALLLPILTYGDAIFAHSLDSSSKQALYRVFNSCIRYVYGLNRYDSVSEFSQRLLGCDILDYISFRSCTFLFRLLTFRQPLYLFELLQFSYSRRTRNFIPVRHRSAHYNSSFFVRGLLCWNALPVSVKSCVSTGAFKTHCLRHYCDRV